MSYVIYRDLHCPRCGTLLQPLKGSLERPKPERDEQVVVYPSINWYSQPRGSTKKLFVCPKDDSVWFHSTGITKGLGIEGEITTQIRMGLNTNILIELRRPKPEKRESSGRF